MTIKMRFTAPYESLSVFLNQTILLTKTTAAQNEVALSYHRLRGLYFPADAFMTTI